jgi:gliding motility-associated-like protein
LNPLPYINLGDDIEICEYDVLTLDVYLEGASYLWSDNSTISSGDIDATGFYSVILTDSNGCSNSDTINVIINPLPNSDFTFNPQPTDLNNPNILFSNISSENTSYEWNLGDGTIIENLNNINHTYLFSGEYDVSLISLNEFDCIDTVIYQIIIDPGGFDLFIPNAFTPNNDEHNELFVIKGRYIIDFNIKIFNRWGEKIFESDNIEKHWDGRFQGKLVQQEKYTYLVTVLDINADIHEFPGIVYLIH